MSGSALRERAALLDELHQIVLAMKNLAFAELQRVGRQVEALRPAAAEVLQALAEVEVLQADAAAARQGGSGESAGQSGRASEALLAPPRAMAPVGWWVIGAARGFCGAYNSRLAQAVRALRAADPSVRLWLASQRLQALLDDLPAGASQLLAGCAAIEDVETTLDAWLAELAPATASCRELWLLHVDEAGLVCSQLWPRLGATQAWSAAAPLATRSAAAYLASASAGGPLRRPQHFLPLPQLQAALLRQALLLRLRAGLMAALEQENHWRLAQMQRAQDHLDELGRHLRQRYATLRQAEITDELETLMSSMDSAPPGG
ncbi:MAG: F0F1 ATP synthase subunit gamma [Leptothrix sp. (in: b-proteobacteria)]